MNPNDIDKYIYIRNTPAWLIKSMYGFGIIGWILVLFGYSRYFFTHPIYWWISFPCMVFFTVYFFMSYGVNFYYKQLNVETHTAFVSTFWRHTNTEPTVDIFIPICGEDTEILTQTCNAVAHMNYQKKHIYILDDKGLKEHKKLAKKFGFTYLSRKDKGFMKKAGNIKYGYDRSKGDFIVIFDADFSPHPDFIRELLPYMVDENVAIIQSPQYFEASVQVHNHSKLEYGAANVQEDFYRFIQVARDSLGAPVCCGSNALYRRTALEAIGGAVQIEHSEDMYTGFALLEKGWKVKYLPIVLAVGLCPQGIHPYFHQQHRWCSGSMSLMVQKDFWKSNLSFGQKISFISGFLYYLSYPLTIILSFNAFVILFLYADSLSISDTYLFLPCLLFSSLILSQFRISKPRIGNFFARTIGAYSYSHAVLSALCSSKIDWLPTNTKKPIVSHAYSQVLWFTACYFLVYISFGGVVIQKGLFQVFNINYDFVLFWIIYNCVSIGFMVFQLFAHVDITKKDSLTLNGGDMPAHILWRWKTIGTYTALIIIAFGFPLYHYVVHPTELFGML